MSHKDQDWLENAFKDYKDDYIEDAGFTDMLMASLPETAPVSAESLYNTTEETGRYDWLVLGGAALGSAVVVSQFPLAPFMTLLTTSAQIPLIAGASVLAGAGLLLASALVRKSL